MDKAKETPQERLKRLMAAQLNKKIQKDSVSQAQRKLAVGGAGSLAPSAVPSLGLRPVLPALHLLLPRCPRKLACGCGLRADCAAAVLGESAGCAGCSITEGRLGAIIWQPISATCGCQAPCIYHKAGWPMASVAGGARAGSAADHGAAGLWQQQRAQRQGWG